MSKIATLAAILITVSGLFATAGVASAADTHWGPARTVAADDTDPASVPSPGTDDAHWG